MRCPKWSWDFPRSVTPGQMMVILRGRNRERAGSKQLHSYNPYHGDWHQRSNKRNGGPHAANSLKTNIERLLAGLPISMRMDAQAIRIPNRSSESVHSPESPQGSQDHGSNYSESLPTVKPHFAPRFRLDQSTPVLMVPHQCGVKERRWSAARAVPLPVAMEPIRGTTG